MTPGALLFDLDGTLADTLADIAASANHVRGLGGLDALALEEVRALVGDGARNLLNRALQGNPRGVTVDDVWDEFRAHHAEQCTQLVQLYDGARGHLSRWHSTGHPMAIVTNKPESFAQRIVDHLDLGALLPVVIGGETLPVRKPDPEPIFEALRRLGATADGATMIGDGRQDVRAGKAARVRTVGALYGFAGASAIRAEEPDELWSAFGVPE